MHRLFVALRPPPTVRDQLTGLMGGIDGARWQDDEQLHITVRYIGEVERPVAEDIALALGTIRSPAIDLHVAGCGTFDSRGRVHSLWVGVAPREPLVALHRKIDRTLVTLGLAPERRAYLPHITLARMGGGAGPVDNFLTRHAALTGMSFIVDHMILYESILGPHGSCYEPVARYPLTGS